ncbi:unnamed protein product [Closterium sp. Yama58-4]|nr:unnamed protein product [Closterium sp. Yama58-4]
MPSPLTALPNCSPCIGDFAVHPGDWPRVGSESALPDDVLLGLCWEDPAFTQCSALSAPPPTQPLVALPASMPSPLAALPGSALGSTSSCVAVTRAGDASASQELEYLDACIGMLGNGNNSNDSNGNGCGVLFLNTPMAHVLLGGGSLAHQQALAPTAPRAAGAAPRAACADLPEWAVEQGGAWEGGAEPHLCQYEQLKGCERGEFERILPPQQLLQPLRLTPFPPAHSQHRVPHAITSPLNTLSNPRDSHMRAPIQPRPAMLQQPFPTGGASSALYQVHGSSGARRCLYSES